ncbi:MAG: TlpA disulfide reductase family protein [Planctomycetota bacterium]
MYPHERSLVEKFEGRPFTILGVNSDADRDKIRETCEEKKLTWPSFWDGGSTQGPIASRWNVSAWPTIYVLDDKGVIRARDLRGEPLEEVLDALVAEAEARAGKAEAAGSGEAAEAGHGK